MSRVPPTPVEVCLRDRWYRGTLRTCEVSHDEATCSGVVSYKLPDGVHTGRFPAEDMRTPAHEPGCPAEHQDDTCGGDGAAAACC